MLKRQRSKRDVSNATSDIKHARKEEKEEIQFIKNHHNIKSKFPSKRPTESGTLKEILRRITN